MRFSIHAASVAMLAALGIFANGIGPAESKARHRHRPTAQDTQQDLPVPHPSSRRTSGHHHLKPPASADAGGPQDMSGGNGQMLTRRRKF